MFGIFEGSIPGKVKVTVLTPGVVALIWQIEIPSVLDFVQGMISAPSPITCISGAYPRAGLLSLSFNVISMMFLDEPSARALSVVIL